MDLKHGPAGSEPAAMPCGTLSNLAEVWWLYSHQIDYSTAIIDFAAGMTFWEVTEPIRCYSVAFPIDSIEILHLLLELHCRNVSSTV